MPTKVRLGVGIVFLNRQVAIEISAGITPRKEEILLNFCKVDKKAREYIILRNYSKIFVKIHSLNFEHEFVTETKLK